MMPSTFLKYKAFRQITTMVLLGILLMVQSSCGMYSFTGASIPPEAKTVSVQFFPNKAQLVVATLSPTFTETLQDQFQNQTTLDLVDRNGDLALEGEITDYRVTPSAIQGDQTAALNKLTITVNVRFTNKYEPDKDFEQKFTQFIEYPSDTDLTAEQDNFIETITDMLATDIFNKAVINW
ncbi:MAG: LptE family protein [bacterium]|jgi:hypothetical protein